MGDKYTISTLESPLEILQIFGNSISKAFPNTEVLSLHNVCGEGTSLTHEENDFLLEELRFFPKILSEVRNFLKKNTSNFQLMFVKKKRTHRYQ